MDAATCWAVGALPIAVPTAALGESDAQSNARLSSDTQQPKKNQAGMPILVLPWVEGHSPAWYLLSWSPGSWSLLSHSSTRSAWHPWAEPVRFFTRGKEAAWGGGMKLWQAGYCSG